jgi:hypothetical protein
VEDRGEEKMDIEGREGRGKIEREGGDRWKLD